MSIPFNVTLAFIVLYNKNIQLHYARCVVHSQMLCNHEIKGIIEMTKFAPPRLFLLH
jgi:hypothetical protein